MRWSLQCAGLKGHFDGWAKSIHSVRLLQRSGQSPTVRCTASHWSVTGKVRLPRPWAKVALQTIGAWLLVTATWRAQRSFSLPGKVHSFGLLQS